MSLLSRFKINNKTMVIIMIIILGSLIADISLSRTYDLVIKREFLGWKIVLFALLLIIYAVGQYCLLEFVKQKRNKDAYIIKKIRLSTLHKLVMAVQYAFIVLLFIILLQMVTMSNYNAISFIAIISIGYVLAITLLGLLALRFFSWYKSNRNPVVLLYGISAAILAFNIGSTLILVNFALVQLPQDIQTEFSGTAYAFISSLEIVLNDVYFISSVVSFIVAWVATTLLLHHYTQRLGRVKYWIILAIPLVYFLSQFVTLLLNAFGSLLQLDPILFSILLTLIFTLSKPIGGILFGTAFWITARGMTRSNVLRNYLIISGYGFVLLFTSNQAIILITTPYPPFGLITVSFLPISSYLLLVGIYSSAISVSLDITLRKSIQNSIQQHSKFLGSIGKAQMEHRLQDVVTKITKEYSSQMAEQTGIEAAITEDDIKQYVSEVRREIEVSKKSLQSDSSNSSDTQG